MHQNLSKKLRRPLQRNGHVACTHLACQPVTANTRACVCCGYLTLPEVTFLEVLDPQRSVWLRKRKEHAHITHANIGYYLGDEGGGGQRSLKVCVKCV